MDWLIGLLVILAALAMYTLLRRTPTHRVQRVELLKRSDVFGVRSAKSQRKRNAKNNDRLTLEGVLVGALGVDGTHNRTNGYRGTTIEVEYQDVTDETSSDGGG